jgi:hypothetical protein
MVVQAGAARRTLDRDPARAVEAIGPAWRAGRLDVLDAIETV